MPVTTPQAREIVRRFLSVFGYPPDGEDTDTVIDWTVIFRMPLTANSTVDKNWCRRLLIVTARHYLEDPNLSVSYHRWNKHIESLPNGRETVADFVVFVGGAL